MGLERRKKSGRDFGGTKLNVPGQGIFTVERSPNDKIHIHKQIGRVPRPTQTPKEETPTPTPTITETPILTPTPTITPTTTPTITPTITPTNTPTITPTITPTNTITTTPTPTITPSATCERPSGLTFTIALYEYDGNYFTTGLTSTCEALSNYIITSGSSSGLGYGINTLNSPIQIGDYVYSGFSFDTNCTTVPDGYYIITSPTNYIIEVSGGTVVSLPNCEIDPLSLGQPILYYSSYYPSFLSPSPIVSGDPIDEMFRVNDSGYTATTYSATCSPYWGVLSGQSMIYFPEVPSSDPCYLKSLYEDTTPVSFVHQPNYSYTIYIVCKPEYVSYSTQYIFINVGSSGTGTRGFGLEYSESGSTYNLRYRVLNGLGGPGFFDVCNFIIESTTPSTDIDSKDLRVFSIRANDPNDLINDAFFAYINETQVYSGPQNAIPTDVTVVNNLKIGAVLPVLSPSRQYKGYLADFLIFNTMHDESTHYWVTQYLKTRWNIT